MFCLQAKLHSLFWMIFLSPCLGISILSSPYFNFTVCTCVCVCACHVFVFKHVSSAYVLWRCLSVSLFVRSSCLHSASLSARLYRHICFPVKALTPPLSPTVPRLSSLHLFICIVMIPEWIYSLFSLISAHFEENGNHQPQSSFVHKCFFLAHDFFKTSSTCLCLPLASLWMCCTNLSMYVCMNHLISALVYQFLLITVNAWWIFKFHNIL